MRWVCVALLLAGCGRTGLLPDQCILVYSPQSIDFGEVAPGTPRVEIVGVENHGAEVCEIHALTFTQGSDDGFSLPSVTPFEVWPHQTGSIAVQFLVSDASIPLTRKATLTFAVNDPKQPTVQVPLQARIQSDCHLTIQPPAIDFGHVMLGDTATKSTTVTNTGIGPCEIAGVAIGTGSDSEFAVSSGQELMFNLAPGQSAQIDVDFHATDLTAPHHRTGTLIFQSTDPGDPDGSVPLSADIDIGCDLTITPPSLDFGNVILNTTTTDSVTLGNDGTEPCNVSGIALGAGTDPGFTLAAGQPTAFTVDPGATQSIPVSFGAFDSDPPHLKTGTLIFQTGNTRMPNATVPLSAFINTKCVDASQWIYTVDANSMFSRFDPATLSFTDIGNLACPDGQGPESMAVDQDANAWVLYTDGNLFEVDTSTAACTTTTFQPGQDGILEFGMGFVFDPSTGLDTLFVAGGPTTMTTATTLATISFPGLVVTPIGPTDGQPELTGTGDGTLWGFFPATASQTGVATLAQIDPATGATLESHQYPSLVGGSDWAMKFWGGSFWIFLDQSVYRVDRNTPDVVTTAIANTGRSIVGAGVSTCAPLH